MYTHIESKCKYFRSNIFVITYISLTTCVEITSFKTNLKLTSRPVNRFLHAFKVMKSLG